MEYPLHQIQAAERLIELGDRAVEIIVENAALFEEPRKPGYDDYLVHHENLRVWVRHKLTRVV